MSFLITGAGRQGTLYMAKALCLAGLDVGHERVARDGIVSSLHCFKTDEFDPVLHQVRDPLSTIASMQTGHSWKWTCQFLPVEPEAPLLQRCCYNWLVFNEHAEKHSVFTYQIERLKESWPVLQTVLNFEASYSVLSGLSKKTHSRKHGSITWEDVYDAAPEIYEDILVAARRYGYETSR